MSRAAGTRTATELLGFEQAATAAIISEMRRDERVVMWGEDITRRGSWAALDEFGRDRVRNTPIVETAIVDMAVGAAITGLRPIAVITSSGFVSLCFDGIFLRSGAYHQLHNYKGPVPLVIYTTIVGGSGSSDDHGLSPEGLLIHSPGLKVVAPSTPYDAKGLMAAAIRDDRPAVFLSHRQLVRAGTAAVPTDDYVIPLGTADVKAEGSDVTIVAWSWTLHKALDAAKELAAQGISAEVVDPRTLVPLDIQTIVRSVAKTRRLLVVHEAMQRGGPASEIICRVIEHAPDVAMSLKAPFRRLGHKNIALPPTVDLERMIVPQVGDIVSACREMCRA
jgi:acetoin:2,6-dichlorophenolindophenol oxidoreductase subunit beta